ncbi:glycosyltransferase, partial [Enterococcus faecalis]|nr:glycosyltransferase [Enterococcus faecalis]
MSKISIIVPVYNVEKYLEKCVRSILAQTFTDFELILVDDGSPDSSGAMCDQFAEQDQRVKVIHKENGGLSDARNAGIEIAQGEFLGFVDSDDYIEEDMYELLYTNAIKEQADISACGLYDVYDNRELKIDKYIYRVLDSETALKTFVEGNISNVTVTSKMFKRSLFDNIRFPVGKITEDAFIIVDLVRKSKKIVLDTRQKYFYYHRENSITTNQFSKKDFDTIEAYVKNLELVQDYFPNLVDTIRTKLCWANFVVLDKIILSNKINKVSETKDIVKFLRKNFGLIMKSNMLTKGRKISMIFLMINIHLYKL